MLKDKLEEVFGIIDHGIFQAVMTKDIPRDARILGSFVLKIILSRQERDATSIYETIQSI